jgi:hypothetical protein
MKLRQLFVAAAVISLLFVKSAPVFAQVVSARDVADALEEFSDDMSGALPFMATIGLDWSDAYIGQLIDITPHWGIGISTGATTLKLDKLNALLDYFGYQADDGFMDKQLLPAYALNARIGGFRTAPFDIGIKWGWLPYLPIFKNDISYEAVVYGIDFRWEVMRDWGVRPSMSVGFEVTRASGGLRSKSATIMSGGGVTITTAGDATIGAVWEAWIFDAKLQIAKKFWEPHFTVFGGLRAGAALARTGYQIIGSGSDILVTYGGNPAYPLADLNDSSRGAVASALEAASGNSTKFEADEANITAWIDKFAIDLNLHGGFGLNFGSGLKLDLSLMADIIHFELGANLIFRYQQ